MSDTTITLIVPTHNEQDLICERSLKTLSQQELGDLRLKVLVIPNGCQDATAKNARNFISKQSKKNISWQVEELELGHRTKSLNYGISLAETDIVMYLNPDCILEPNAIKTMYDCITGSDKLNYVGMLEEPDLSFLKEGTMLYKTIQLLAYNRKISGTHPPSGRFIAFRKEIFPKFPEIHSEDTWASLYTYKEYGPESLKVFMGQTVKFIPYTNWIDFMKVGSRYMEGTYEVFERFPGYEEVDKKRAAEGKLDDETRMSLIADFCTKNDIDMEFVQNIKNVIFPLVVENTKLVRQLSDSGTWELV
ncbi:glycosyltransferase [candidate division WWE3 bacterium]|nr:glycosyltransferase [candidate division WWE3 bacterium]